MRNFSCTYVSLVLVCATAIVILATLQPIVLGQKTIAGTIRHCLAADPECTTLIIRIEGDLLEEGTTLYITDESDIAVYGAPSNPNRLKDIRLGKLRIPSDVCVVCRYDPKTMNVISLYVTNSTNCERIEGPIVKIYTKAITIDTRSFIRPITLRYTNATVITVDDAPARIEDLKAGMYAYCVYDPETDNVLMIDEMSEVRT